MRSRLGWTLVSWLILLPAVAFAQVDDWAAVQALPRDSRVMVHEIGPRGGSARGRFLLPTDSEMTLLRGGRPVVIPKPMIGRVVRVKRDPVWTGFAIGLLYGLIMRATYAAEACLGREEPTVANVVATAGVGALIDLGINDDRVVYKAAQRAIHSRPTATLLRLSF